MDEEDVTSDSLPAFLYPEWPEQDAAAQSGMPRRTIALIASGGVALLVMIGLVVAALTSGDDGTENRPAAANRAVTNGPVVPVESQSPTPEPSPSPTEPSPSPSKPKATKSPTPSKTTPAKPTVTAASISINPSTYEGSCNQGMPMATATLRISVSVPDTQIQWRINGVSNRTVVQGTTYTTNWPIQVPRKTGTYRTELTVTSPTSASDSATFTVRCRNG